MYFERKAYKKLLEWKEKYAEKYAVLLEGARRVGKSTIAEHFAQNEYRSYILIDFSKTTDNICDCFNDIGNLNLFFLRLQAETGVTLYEHESLIIFDEVQLFPKARQAIKHLVADGRYSYLETGSLISIKKNVKDILIPSEEMKIQVYPMDYEEFCMATGNNYELLQQIYRMNSAIGQATNRKLMRDLRIYMAVGGMPQAVEAYIEGKNFSEIDMVNGYDAGADDYITKPFSLMVLVSKVQAFMRRMEGVCGHNRILSGNIEVNYGEMRALKRNADGVTPLTLSKKELQIMIYFMENARQILSKEQILEYVWDVDGQFVDDNTVPVNISRLKGKIGNDYIQNVRGMGYIWTEESVQE